MSTARASRPAGQLLDVLLGKRGAWRDLGLCRQADPDAFYPDKGGHADAAKRVCAVCPVRAECLAEALRADERHGVWGGTTPTERKHLRQTRAGKGPGMGGVTRAKPAPASGAAARYRPRMAGAARLPPPGFAGAGAVLGRHGHS